MPRTQPTLIQFEAVRKQENVIPPLRSNSFFPVGEGRINLFTVREDPLDYRFDLFTDQGIVYTGPGNFFISGDIEDISFPYRNLTVITRTTLKVNQFLTVSKGELNIYGIFELLPQSQIHIIDEGNVIFHPNSVLVINDNTDIVVSEGSNLTIYGRIDIHVTRIDSLRTNPNITIDSAAVFNVSGIEGGHRTFSLVDYDAELRKTFMNTNTQGERNFPPSARIGYIWREGDPKQPSHVLGISTHIGNVPLGDFRLSLLGRPIETYPNMQTLSDLIIMRNSTLYITEKFNDESFIRPELYLGVIIDNTRIPSNCTVHGTIIVDGINSSIIVDRGSTLKIEENGWIHLKNDSVIISTYNDDKEVFFIDGTLVIDDISQINTFNSKNIVFGKRGKVVILNPSKDEKRIILSIPNGIQESDLYKLFSDRIDHIEYHMSSNTGIAIDQHFESYSREMVDWIGNRRFEKAIHDKILIWHPGAYIEMYSYITPWVNRDTNLYMIGRLFKSFGWYEKDRLQDVVNRLIYAGCGDILFRFVLDNDDVLELNLSLESVYMKSVVHDPIEKQYDLDLTNTSGMLFLRNNIRNINVDNLVHPDARKIKFQGTSKIGFTV